MISCIGSCRRRCARLICALGLLVLAPVAGAHPAPFSYLDLHLDETGASGVLVIHDFDAAHELGIDDPASLLAAGVAAERGAALVDIVDGRLGIELDGRAALLRWQAIEPLPERQSLRLGFRLDSVLFPYDPAHQTFVNVYEDGVLERQAILDADKHRLEHYTGSVQGRFAVARAFVVSGIEHILIGPDHLAFLLGLLLLGGSLPRLAAIVTAFTLGHSVTLSLAALDWLRLSPALVEPAIALSVVVVGVDNLLVRQRRGAAPAAAQFDLRPWLAAAFGLLHGFGFAAVLREIGLPPGALGWSLAAFNVGVELGQLAVVAVAVGALALVRRHDVHWIERCAFAGSVGIIAAGLFWFGQRIGLIA